MNKVIKFVLLVLFIVISISSANIVKNNFVDKQIEKIMMFKILHKFIFLHPLVATRI